MIKMSEMIMIACVFFVACYPNTDPLDDSQESIAQIENALEDYYESFELEAAKRGLRIELDNYDLKVVSLKFMKKALQELADIIAMQLM